MSEKPKQKPYTMTQAGGICFTSDRNKNPEIRVDNWIYDLWLPLLGATVLGVYTLYCRLDNGDRIWGMTLDDISRICRVGKKTLMDIHLVLEECKFIKVKRPSGVDRLKHFTTEIKVLTPPKEITLDVIEKYQHPQGYQAVTRWLVNDDFLPSTNENFEDFSEPDETTRSSNQNEQVVPHETSKDPYISRSILLEDQSSMHANNGNSNFQKDEPTQTGMNGWMDDLVQNPNFVFLRKCGVLNNGVAQELMVLPLTTLEEQWAIVKKSTVEELGKPGLLVKHLRSILEFEAAQQRAAAERAANPAPVQTQPQATSMHEQYNQPHFATVDEWAALNDAALYELLEGAFLNYKGQVMFPQEWQRVEFMERYNSVEVLQRFEAVRNWQPAEDWS